MADAGEADALDERLRLVLLCAHPAWRRSRRPRSRCGWCSASHRGHRSPVPGPTADDGGPADPGPQAARRRALRAAVGPSSTDRLAVAGRVAYLAFTAGYAPGSGADVVRADLAGEAIRLVRVLREVAARARASWTRCSP